LVIPLQFANKLHGDSWGGEIGSTLEVTSQWRLSGSYSLLEVAFESEPGSTDTISAGRDDGAAPENQFQVHSSLDVTKNVQFNTAVYYVGRVPLYDVPSYLSTDLNVSWQIKEGVVLQVGILNLFDPHHSEYGILPDNAIASETPRTIYAELSYKF
jgi:iron complex outermembrane receptor protein